LGDLYLAELNKRHVTQTLVRRLENPMIDATNLCAEAGFRSSWDAL
jgi:hypothetical protein